MCRIVVNYKNMDQFHSSATVDELLNALMDTILRLKDLVKNPEPDCFVPQFLRPTLQEMYEQQYVQQQQQQQQQHRSSSLKHCYQRQYALEYDDDDDDGDDDVFELLGGGGGRGGGGGECDEFDISLSKIDSEHQHQHQQQQQQQYRPPPPPHGIESYYTAGTML